MKHHSSLPRSHVLYTIAVMGFIYTLHLVLPVYSNSSFLSLFLSDKNLGLTYMLASAVTVLGFLYIPVCIRKIGNYTITLWLIIIQAVCMFVMINTFDSRYIALFFALQSAIIALIGFCLDIFLEVYTKSSNVGAVRGMYMTTMNVAWIIAPLIGSMIIDGGDKYRDVYIAALFMLVPLFYMVAKNFPRFKDPHYQHPSLHQTFAHFFKHKNHSRLFTINTILQLFYAWMTIYSPIYLHTVIGLDWNQIGIVITIMLVPFALIELPLGKLADKKYGEKEMMMAGFALLGLTTIALSLITSKNVWVWALALFLTRIGAASAEIMIETYFFKTTDPSDSAALGFFRVTRYVSYFLAPLLTGALLIFTHDQSNQFIAVGVICLLALIPIAEIKDTK